VRFEVSMTSVRFEIHRLVGSYVEELDEDAITRRLATDPAFVAALCSLDPIEGALTIDGTSILDDLSSAVQRLCFEASPVLVAGGPYTYAYFNANAELQLVPRSGMIALHGDGMVECAFSSFELLRGLCACGVRYLALLEQLGAHGRAASAVDLAHLRPFAARALDAYK
jgi:hypothetical protein